MPISRSQATGSTKTADGYHLGKLSNGLRMVFHPETQGQSFSVGMWVRAGGRYEMRDHAGVSHFLEHLLFKGTRRRSCEELKRAIEGVGGSLNAFTSEEYTCYIAKVPRRYSSRAVDVLVDMMKRPRLLTQDIEREREVILEEIRMYEDTPGQYVHDLFNELLWPNHPLGTLLSGTIDTVRRIGRQELVQYWRKMYQPGNLAVACVGAFDEKAISAQIETSFSAIRARPSRPFVRAPRPRAGGRIRVWNKTTEQTHLCVGTYAMARAHPDRFALELLHLVLGANTSSRLFREVREKRGLAYEIGTQIKRYQDTGAFVTFAGCDAGKLKETLTIIFTELARMRRRRVPDAELKRAKDYYSGQLMIGIEDTMDHMLWIGEQLITSGRVCHPKSLLERLGKVTSADVYRVSRRLLNASRMHVAVVGTVTQSEASRLISACCRM